jgi:hypothetical protein
MIESKKSPAEFSSKSESSGVGTVVVGGVCILKKHQNRILLTYLLTHSMA